MYIYICTHKSSTDAGWYPPTYPEGIGVATSTLKDLGMATFISDEMAIIYIYIYIYISKKHKSETVAGWHPPTHPQNIGIATSTLKDMGMSTSILDDMAVETYIDIPIYIYTCKP